MTNLSLNEVVADFSKMIKRLIGEDIQVIMALQDDLPLIQADLTMMEQILLNLVVNARDAMPNGGTPDLGDPGCLPGPKLFRIQNRGPPPGTMSCWP